MSLLILLAAVTLAAPPNIRDFSPILLPMHEGDAVGAGRSVWPMDEVIVNAIDSTVQYYPHYSFMHPLFAPPDVALFAPHARLDPAVLEEPRPCRVTCPPPYPGAILWVSRHQAAAITAYDRVFELSKDRENHGAVVPAVGEQSLRRGSALLAELPLSADFRTTIRIDNLAESTRVTVRVRDAGGRTLARSNLVLPGATGDCNTPLRCGRAISSSPSARCCRPRPRVVSMWPSRRSRPASSGRSRPSPATRPSASPSSRREKMVYPMRHA